MSKNIKELLKNLKTYPKKSMGQNFLINKNKIEKIINIISNENYKSIIEIGPGLGSITDRLVEINKNIICIEKDKNFFNHLKDKYSLKKNLRIYNKDILKCNLKKLGTGEKLFFGNLPYNIATKIVENLSDTFHADNKISAIFMFQKEVADKILSNKNSKLYNGFVVKIRTFYNIKKILNLNESDFWPQPRVKSVLLKFENKNIKYKRKLDYKEYSDFIYKSFSVRRKKLTNNLQKKFPRSLIIEKLTALGLDKDVRAQDLEINKFIELHQILKGNKF